MATKSDEFLKKLLATFKLEAAEHVQALSSGLIGLERTTPGEQMEVIETVFREAHSLKGAARAVGLTEIESICQSVESVFSALKRKELGLSPALFDMLHDAVDALGRLLPSIGSERPGKEGVGPRRLAKEKSSMPDLLRRLDGAVKGVGAALATAAAQAETAAPVQPRPESARTPPEEKAVLADTVRITTARLDALLFQAEGLLSAKLTASQRAAEIREAMNALVTLKKEQAKIAPSVKDIQRKLGKSGKRNGADKLDSPLRKLLEFVEWENAFVKSFEAKLAMLASSADHDHRSLGGIVDGLLEDMKKALMLPISSALEMLPKFVRDFCRDRRKEVEFVVRGGEIEVDRRILEQMRDPFIHLVRNSIDHGIETPEARTRKNKPPRGTVTFSIMQKDGSKIEILVSDDGAGIDLAKVGEAAQKLGVISREDAETGEQQKLLSLVFQSGVSTSPIITNLSGRGLGLAIVREKVEKLGGAISVETKPGRGTVFRVVLPLTLATFRGVQVRVNDQLFVLPTTHVEQAARLKRDVIKTVENRETIRWNGQALALAHLADVLELPRKVSKGAPDDTVLAVVLGAADNRVAFLVDEILDEQEVLVKPLGKQLSRVRNIGGATVLGTGKVAPILDVPDLLRSALKVAAAPIAATVDKREIPAETKSILVAEDSITARTLLKNILESAGYKVSTAVDGIDAFSLLRTERFDLMVSDVDMPRMNGFDLTAKIRADKALSELPVVLVTALESRDHRERGIDVGANAYIVKSSFDQSNLLDVIRRLI